LGSVVYRNAVIAPGARVEGSIIGASSIVGDRSIVREAVIADAVRIGADNEILSGMRIFPGATIADTTVRFSSDR
jgi:mannose-1-phosphate guanylyltransferase